MPRLVRKRHTWCGNESSASWMTPSFLLGTGKSVWICSNTRAEKELNKLLQEGDPQVQSLAKDLGVDSAWGRRRRLATHKARFRKGQQRQKRLVQLAPAQSAKTKACKQSVFGAALYGHMAMGLAPKRLKWVRHQHAAVLGRNDPWIDRGCNRAGRPQA